MRFILALFALAGAACVALIFFHAGRPAEAPPQELAAPQQQPAPAVAAAPAPAAPAEAPTVSTPAPKPEPRPAAAPAQKPAARPPVAAVAPRPAFTIQPPQGLEGVAFGSSADQIAGRFPIGWRKETTDELTLVYYPHGEGDQVRFHFNQQGLSKLELLLKPPQGQNPNQFYQAVRQRYAAIYGSRPGPSNIWDDGHTILRIGLEPTGVSVLFYPKG